MDIIAIIPARGGSKRIPRKNIRLFRGRPIIEYAIRTALAAGCFSEVMVSTDDEEIAQVAVQGGAQVPFMRSREAASDYATTAEVLLEVLERYREAGREFVLGCCIYPCSVLIGPERLQEGHRLLLEDRSVNGIVPVLKFSYPVQRALRIENGWLRMIAPENLDVRSQDLEPTYHDAGQYYWFRSEAVRSQRTLLGAGVLAVHLSDLEAQDIDSAEDWQLAELKYELRMGAHRNQAP